MWRAANTSACQWEFPAAWLRFMKAAVCSYVYYILKVIVLFFWHFFYFSRRRSRGGVCVRDELEMVRYLTRGGKAIISFPGAEGEAWKRPTWWRPAAAGRLPLCLSSSSFSMSLPRSLALFFTKEITSIYFLFLRPSTVFQQVLTPALLNSSAAFPLHFMVASRKIVHQRV